MKFDYKTPEQLEAEKPMLKEGRASFEIRTALEKISKSSHKPMLELKVQVWDIDGKSSVLFDYITASQSSKIKSLCDAIGKPEWYAPDYDLIPSDLEGFSGDCQLKIEKSQDPNYADKMKIHFYIKKESIAKVESSDFPDDDIPF